MIDKDKIKHLRNRIEQLIKLNEIDAQIFILIFDSDENFICGHGCPKCTSLALVDFLEANEDVEHNCGEIDIIDVKKVN